MSPVSLQSNAPSYSTCVVFPWGRDDILLFDLGAANVGDSLAFVHSQKYGVREITLGLTFSIFFSLQSLQILQYEKSLFFLYDIILLTFLHCLSFDTLAGYGAEIGIFSY